VSMTFDDASEEREVRSYVGVIHFGFFPLRFQAEVRALTGRMPFRSN
jgi:hypothetical protein